MNLKNEIKTWLVANQITGYHIELITGRSRTGYYNALTRSRAFLHGFHCGLTESKIDQEIIKTFHHRENHTFQTAAKLGTLVREFATTGIKLTVPVEYLVYEFGVDISQVASAYAALQNKEIELAQLEEDRRYMEEVSGNDVIPELLSSYADVTIKRDEVKISFHLLEYTFEVPFNLVLDILPEMIKKFSKS